MPESRLLIEIHDDGMAADATIKPGAPVDPGEFARQLAEEGVVTGILPVTFELLARSLADPNFVCASEPIAVGTNAQPGKDAWFEPSFAQGIQAGHLREDGSLDYHDRELLKPVCRGDVLGVLHPAVTGQDGQRVDGTRIAAPAVRATTINCLGGVVAHPDGSVSASRDGVILYKAGQSLDVVDQQVHQGSVDLHSGDLHMQGSLVIQGDVLRPFSVVATGDIQVRGRIQSATVHAGGQLKVGGGIRGGEGGTVSAEGDVTVSHIEGAELICGATLRLKESVNSRLTAARLLATGRVRGGYATVEAALVIKEAGTEHGVDTQLTAGEPLELPLVEARRSIANMKTQRMSERTGGRMGGRTSERAKGGKVGRAKTEMDATEVQRLAERAKRREALCDSALVQIEQVHPGVTIRIGDAHRTFDAPTALCRFTLDRETHTLRLEKITR